MNGWLQSGSASIETWTEERFSASRAEWQELLGRSDADPLFMSWDWQWCWWHHAGRHPGSELVLLAVRDGESRLRALAPFHLRRIQHRTGEHGMRLELLGAMSGGPGAVHSEGVDVIVDREYVESTVSSLTRYLRDDQRWGDLVFGNTPATGLAARIAREELGDCHLREVDALEARSVRLPSKFGDYLEALPERARCRLWGERSRIPDVVLEYTHDVTDFLGRLDGLHREGHARYQGVPRNFHLDFASFAAQRGELRMSSLIVDGRTISAIYAIRCAGREYTLHAEFDQKITGCSPGWLHLGYAMERACVDGVQGFEFVANPDGSRQHTQDLPTNARPLTTLQVIRAKHLSLFDRGQDLPQPFGDRHGPGAAP